MTFEERLDRIGECTQAIAESLELLGHRVESLAGFIEQDAQNIRRLAHIAEIHENRITHLEGGEPA